MDKGPANAQKNFEKTYPGIKKRSPEGPPLRQPSTTKKRLSCQNVRKYPVRLEAVDSFRCAVPGITQESP